MQVFEAPRTSNTLVSWLGSVYSGSSKSEVITALKSIVNQDINVAFEIVLVIDGKILESVYSSIHSYLLDAGIPFILHQLPSNVGLALALNEGIKLCSAEYISRFDTDDINLPNRLSTQLSFMQRNTDISVLGSSCYEFCSSNHSGSIAAALRSAYCTDQITFLLSFVNPIYHPTVMIRRDLLLRFGGYPNQLYFEDYALWLLMRSQSIKFANIQEPLVYMRSDSLISRRYSLTYACREFRFFIFVLTRRLVHPSLFPIFLIRIITRIIAVPSFQKFIRRRGRRTVLIPNPDCIYQ